jgi:hypothetical protein
MPLNHVLHFGLAVAEVVKRTGGKARCFKTTDAVVVEQIGVSRDQLEEFVDSMANAVAKTKDSLTMIIEGREAPEIDLDTEGVIPGEYIRPKLTKKLFFSLPEGAIVIGNSFVNGLPEFAAHLEAGKDRSRIWRQATKHDAVQRICDIFWNPQDVREVYGIDLDTLGDDDDYGDIPPTYRN